MYKQKSLESRDINYIYENSWVWVSINSIKKKNGVLYREIFDHYKNRNKIFCFFKGRVKKFVSSTEAEICIDINDNYDKLKNNVNYNIIENIKYLLPIDKNFGCSDNTELIYLNPPNLVENLYQRYNKAYLNEKNRNCIYTYIGHILLSVNPYENFKIYDENYMHKVKEENNLFSIPHPFSIANDAYKCLVKEKISQSIIISGESGAGKTELSKQVLTYLTYLSSWHKDEWKRKNGKKRSRHGEKGALVDEGNFIGEDAKPSDSDHTQCRWSTCDVNEVKYSINVLHEGDINERCINGLEKTGEKMLSRNEPVDVVDKNEQRKRDGTSSYEEKIQNSNPLLESFGNAKTIKNDNSSRFGKLMKLNYNDNGILCSASIETYLLAKSRVVNVPQGEGNYHIFYALCENERVRSEFNMLPWYKYNYLKERSPDGIGGYNEQGDVEDDGDDLGNDMGNAKKKKREKGKRKKVEKSEGADVGEKEKRNRKNKGSYEDRDGGRDGGKDGGRDEGRDEGRDGERDGGRYGGRYGGREQNDRPAERYQCAYDLNAIIRCFNSIGVLESEQREIYKTLICILLLGNVDFVEESTGEGGPLKIKNEEVCAQLSKLLEVKNKCADGSNKIVEILTIKKVRETQKNYTYQQAIYNRDVISKALYQLLFDYVILRVNNSLNVRGKREEEESLQVMDDNTGGRKQRKSNKRKKIYAKLDDQYGEEENWEGYFIGILDIYGFENFNEEGKNCFEQLCINYANEILHSFFLKQIIHNEQKIYYEENLCIQNINYNDNSNVISLIGDTRDVSIYTILEDLALLCSSHKSSEENKKNTFFENLNKKVINCAKYKCIIRNYKHSKNCFIISHYAGDVIYDCHDFFYKNVDILTNDIEEFLSSCNTFISTNLLRKKKYQEKDINRVNTREDTCNSGGLGTESDTKLGRRKLSVKEIICGHEEESKGGCVTGISDTSGNGCVSGIGGHKVKSIFSSFKKQLEILTSKLERTRSKFIRCIKPNEEKQAKRFNKNLVLNQLIMSGMVDILSLMKNGYPCRVLYDDIWTNYSTILQDDMKKFLTPKMFCEIVLKFLQISSSEYTFGRTKIFFRFGVLSLISEILNKNENNKNKFIACVYKFWLNKRKRAMLIFILCGCRFKILFKKQRAKMLMDCGLHVYNAYLFNEKKKSMKKILFFYFNVYKQRIHFLNLRVKTLIIQKNYRMYILRKKFLYMKRQLLFIQDYYLFQKYFKERVKASTVIRKNWLMYITRSDYHYVLCSIIKIQKAFKKYMQRKYISYCLKIACVKKQPNRTYTLFVKQEAEEKETKKIILPPSHKPRQEIDRIGSFICIDAPTKRRHSFAMGERLSYARSGSSLRKRRTWGFGEGSLTYGNYGMLSYKCDNSDIRNGSCNKKDNLREENIRRFSNLSVCNRGIDTNPKRKNNGKHGKNQMNRRTYNNNTMKNDFTSSYKRGKCKATTFLKSTIYDRYFEKYRQNHTTRQIEKKKKSMYIKSNYSNISNIYSVHKPMKEDKLKEQYNFDLTDALIIPEDFYVCESSIPEPDIGNENDENYLSLCDYLDRNLDSKIPQIELVVFKCL
ncbi:myosin F, putative [Plasmodium ovale]|uniref:Myosin F, putative n=1 Tax=Plasmodium ovale TaxID=36330 RepID=A0A1C3KT06_PLAOA|nr:myosin F, putative [Plasmodium ovale]